VLERSRAPLVALVAVLAVTPCFAEDKPWEEPKDGVLTPKELDAWIDTTGKLVDARDRYLKDLADAEKKKLATLEVVGLLQRFEEETKKIRAASGLANEELDWVGKTTFDTHMTLDMARRAREDLDKREKELRDEADGYAKKRENAEKARKTGRRPMTEEQRAEAKKAAAEEIPPAEANLKSASDAVAEAKKALDAAKKELSEAKDDDAKASSEQAVAGAKDALAQAQATETEARSALERAKRKAKEPDVPQTPEEKEALDRDLVAETEQAKQDEAAARKACEDFGALRKQAYAGYEEALKKFPAKNKELVSAKREKIAALVARSLGAAPPK
jgi:hypothetical protein